MGLEQQLNSYIKSDHRLARLKAARLQSYWKKICEDEKKSQWRNEQLLKDLDRVESHMNTLSARTDKLRTMKKQYEDYIEKTYPYWKEKVLQHLREQQQHDRQVQLQAQVAAQNAVIAAPSAGYVTLPEHRGAYRISSTLPSPQSAGAGFGQTDDIRRDTAPQFQGYTAPTGQGQLQGHTDVQNHFEASAEQYWAHIEEKGTPRAHILPYNNIHTKPRFGETPELNYHQPEPYSTTAIHQRAGVLRDSDQGQGQVVTPSMIPAEDEPEVIEEAPIQPVSSPRRPVVSGAFTEDRVKQGTPRMEAHQQHNVGRATDDTDDFDTDDSLPLEDNKPATVPSGEVPSGHQVSGAVAPDRVQSPDSVYLHPDITLNGLYNLLSVVEEELPVTHQTKEVYRHERFPEESVKREIYQNANKSALLSHLNISSISMVILEQLPLLVVGCEANCLLPDNILYKPSAVATQASVRANIHPTCQAFWDRMCEHFLYLIKYEIMKPAEIGNLFGPLLIAEDSPYEEKVKILVTTVMEAADPDIIKSPASTSTFSTLPPVSPRKRTEDGDVRGQHLLGANTTNRPAVIKEQEEEIIENDKPSKKLEDEKLKSEAIRSESVPREPPASTTPLTQTAAYRQLLGDTMSTSQKTASYEDSDDDDDIEQQLGSMVTGKQQGMQKASDPKTTVTKDKERPFSPTGVSRVSSPSLGSTGGGYIPSAIDTGGKSGTGSFASTGKSAKKGPAFMFGGDTDTDEDIEIPGVGSMENKDSMKHGTDDDFDFYG